MRVSEKRGRLIRKLETHSDSPTAPCRTIDWTTNHNPKAALLMKVDQRNKGKGWARFLGSDQRPAL